MKSFLFYIILFAFLKDVAFGQDCCQKLSLPNECHFLCGTREESWWSLTRWRCMHQHGAEVANCKIKASIDYVKAFGQDFTNTIQKSFNKLSTALQAKLSDASKFATATAEELKTVSQDVLSSLTTVSQMTVTQFRGLVPRFKSFSAENLKILLNKINIDVIFQNIQDLAKETWDLAQVKIISSKVYQKYGKDIAKWTSAQFSSLGNLIAGIPSSDLAKVAANTFDKSLTSICKARLKVYQKISLITPATKAFGSLSNWTSTQIKQMCNLVEALTPEQILELSAKEISDAIDGLKSLSFSDTQLDALLKKAKDQYGQISSWTLSQLQNIGKMVKGLSAADIRKIDKEKIKTMLTGLGNIQWDIAQVRRLGTKLKEALGAPDKWTSADLDKAKTLLKGLVVSELEKIDSTGLKNSLRNLKPVVWTMDQSQVILGKIKEKVTLDSLTKEDVLALFNTVDAWSTSDVGRFSQTVLFAVFPELLIVKTIATPVLRQFIRTYKQQPGSKDISVLKGLAQALTRMELNEAVVADIVVTLEQLTGNDWDEAQIVELMVKVRSKLGNLNLTETIDSDSPPWGSKNLKKLGKVILGLTKDELKIFPIRGIEDSVEVMGKQSGWRRGQIISMILRFREYMAFQNKTIENLGELDLETLGSLVQGFAAKELKTLPQSALSVAIKKLGETSGLPEDKLKSFAFTALEHFKNKSGVDILDTNQVKSLGNLVVGLSKEALSKIGKNAFLSEVYNIAKKPGMTNDKFKELIKLGKKYFGKSDVGQWLGEHWKKLGPAIKGMDAAEIMRINKEAFDDVIDYFGEIDGWTPEQAKAFVLKAKDYWKERDVGKWTGAQLRRLGSLINGLSADEILRIAKNNFKDMIGSCAHVSDLNGAVSKALISRAKQVLANGDAAKFNLTEIKLLGCALTGLDTDDLKKLRLDIDVIAELGKHTGWNTEQLKVLAGKVKTFLQTNVNKENLMSIGTLIKGLTADDIKSLTSDSFKYALGKIGKLSGLSEEQINALILKAKEAWGSDVSTWTAAQVIELGNLFSGMKPEDIPKIDKDAIDQIKISALGKMTKDQIKAFTVVQLKSMDSPQAYALTAEQRSGLSGAQLSALVSVEQSDPQEPDPWACKGVCAGATSIFSPSIFMVLLWTLAQLFWIHH
ncbi:uncharacterized protein LOC135695271 isoform X2 [Rhopilema esculentum]|uniref:uncharacterized protein LOC135695271 isoform X2 n=1 Tax=Rhopilema esculentum TaxID=499914 RepID=UPI0031D79031